MNNFISLILNGKFRYIYSGLRRRLLYCFNRNYINKQIQKRKGFCAAIGHCCKITMPWCGYLENGKCTTYSCQPLFCRIFPIDKKDQELSGVKGICGYNFD